MLFNSDHFSIKSGILSMLIILSAHRYGLPIELPIRHGVGSHIIGSDRDDLRKVKLEALSIMITGESLSSAVWIGTASIAEGDNL